MASNQWVILAMKIVLKVRFCNGQEYINWQEKGHTK